MRARTTIRRGSGGDEMYGSELRRGARGEGVLGRGCGGRRGETVQIRGHRAEGAYQSPTLAKAVVGHPRPHGVPLAARNVLIGGLTVNKKTPGASRPASSSSSRRCEPVAVADPETARLFREIGTRAASARATPTSGVLANMSHDAATHRERDHQAYSERSSRRTAATSERSSSPRTSRRIKRGGQDMLERFIKRVARSSKIEARQDGAYLADPSTWPGLVRDNRAVIQPLGGKKPMPGGPMPAGDREMREDLTKVRQPASNC